MAHFPKPVEGSWTEHFPQLGTAPVNYEDSISPEYYELEKAGDLQADLAQRRTSRTDTSGRKLLHQRNSIALTPRSSSYGTVARYEPSITCAATAATNLSGRTTRTRKSKAPVDNSPASTTGGATASTVNLNFVQQESEFFDLDKADYPLVSVHCEIWEGFIFVNFAAEPAETLLEFLGKVATGLSGYPFGEMTQTFGYKAVVGANWKLFNDAFSEFYHAPVLHQNQSVASESVKLQQFGFEALHYDLFGDSGHGIVSTWGGMSPPKDLEMVKPIERILRSGPVRPLGAAAGH